MPAARPLDLDTGHRSVATAVSGPARVYVICDPADERAVEPLEDFLFEQGLEVCLTTGDSGSAEVSTLRRENC